MVEGWYRRENERKHGVTGNREEKDGDEHERTIPGKTTLTTEVKGLTPAHSTAG